MRKRLPTIGDVVILTFGLPRDNGTFIPARGWVQALHDDHVVVTVKDETRWETFEDAMDRDPYDYVVQYSDIELEAA